MRSENQCWGEESHGTDSQLCFEKVKSSLGPKSCAGHFQVACGYFLLVTASQGLVSDSKKDTHFAPNLLNIVRLTRCK